MDRQIQKLCGVGRIEARELLDRAKDDLKGKNPSPQDLIDRVRSILVEQQGQPDAHVGSKGRNGKVLLVISAQGYLTMKRDPVPRPLGVAGVDPEIWYEIYDTMEDEWRKPYVKANETADKTSDKLSNLGTNMYNNQNLLLMGSDTGTFLAKVNACKHVHAAAQTNAVMGLVANNLLMLANFHLNPHGILCQLKFSSDKSRPIGLEMTVRRKPSVPIDATQQLPVVYLNEDDEVES